MLPNRPRCAPGTTNPGRPDRNTLYSLGGVEVPVRRIPVLVTAMGLAALLTGRPAGAVPIDPQGWTELKTPHFTIYGSVGPDTVREVGKRLEIFRAVLERSARGLRVSSSVPTTVIVFRDAAEFDPYKGERQGESRRILAGYFLPGPEMNFVAMDGGFGEESWRVVHHEFVHQVLAQSLARVPLCLNEGIAEYYSTFRAEGAGAVIGLPVREHVRWLERNDGMPLDRLLRIGLESPEYSEADHSGGFYAQCWALAHYLLSEPGRSARLGGFLDQLNRGGDIDAAFPAALQASVLEIEQSSREAALAGSFGTTQLDLVQLNLPDLEPPLAAGPADVLTALGQLLARLGGANARAAEDHFKLALVWDPRHARARASLASLMRSADLPEVASGLLEEARELAPADPGVLLATAKDVLGGDRPDAKGTDRAARVSKETADRVNDLLKRVLKIEPDNVEANMLLGFTILASGGEPGEGIPPLERAVRLAPTRPEPAFYLLQLYARIGERDKARRLAEGLRGTAPAESQPQIREILFGLDLRRANELLAQNKTREALELFRGVRDGTGDEALRRRVSEEITRLESASPSSSRR